MAQHFASIGGGSLAYDDSGSGPLVIAVPGMGDLRSSFRFLTPRLVAAGYRVVAVDVRGHGESSVDWAEYGVGAIGRDILALVRHLDAGPAHVIGNSMAAGAAVVAAAREPHLVHSLTLLGPFVRDTVPPWLMRGVFGTLLLPPLGPVMWNAYCRGAFPTVKPPDFDAEFERRARNLAQPGRFRAFRRMAIASKAESEAALSSVRTPALVMMGTRDPDFPNPEREARRVAAALGARVAMLKGAGHYPQAEMPETVAREFVAFVRSNDAAAHDASHRSPADVA